MDLHDCNAAFDDDGRLIVPQGLDGGLGGGFDERDRSDAAAPYSRLHGPGSREGASKLRQWVKVQP